MEITNLVRHYEDGFQMNDELPITVGKRTGVKERAIRGRQQKKYLIDPGCLSIFHSHKGFCDMINFRQRKYIPGIADVGTRMYAIFITSEITGKASAVIHM